MQGFLAVLSEFPAVPTEFRACLVSIYRSHCAPIVFSTNCAQGLLTMPRSQGHKLNVIDVPLTLTIKFKSPASSDCVLE